MIEGVFILLYVVVRFSIVVRPSVVHLHVHLVQVWFYKSKALNEQ